MSDYVQFVTCLECGAEGGMADSERSHIDAWNRRASSAPKELIAAGALRQLRHNDSSEGFVFAYDKEVTDKILRQYDFAGPRNPNVK